MTPTYRKSWGRNLLVWSNLTLGSSFKVKRWSLTGFGELSCGYNLQWFSDALGLVGDVFSNFGCVSEKEVCIFAHPRIYDLT